MLRKWTPYQRILNYSSIENHPWNDVYWCKCSADFLKTIDIPEKTNVKVIINFQLKGNDFRLKQLFQNLIQNALKYNDKEHIKLRSQKKRIKNIYF
jgi:signal transduction histidine kinase